MIHQHVVRSRERKHAAKHHSERHYAHRVDRRQQGRAAGNAEQAAELLREDKQQRVRDQSLYDSRFRCRAHEPPDQHMIFLSQIGSQKRLDRHTDAIHNDAELYDADDHCQRDQPLLTVPGGNMADHHIIHHSPAQIDRCVHDAEPHALHQILQGKMPDKMKRITLLEKVQAYRQKTEDIPDDYFDMMGVPVTFFDKYNPDQFEILGITKTWFGMATKTYGEQIQVDKSGKESKVTKLNDGAVLEIDKEPIGKTFYKVDGKMYIQTYPRILIRRKTNSTNI